ncbi:hypothetical protein [Pseudoxanthomonas wuyuanensis]
MSPLPDSPQAIAQEADRYPHRWRRQARAGFDVLVEWRILDSGLAVEGQIRDLASKDAAAFALGLQPGAVHRQTFILRHALPRQSPASIDVTLHLKRDGDSVSLVCNLPITDQEYFNWSIGDWSLQSPDFPASPAGEDRIQAPQDAGDLFPFVWMQPLTRRQAGEIGLHFVACPQPPSGSAAWPLYLSLAGAETAAAKIQAAGSFRQQPQFVDALPQLGATVALMPRVRRQLLELAQPMPDNELVHWLEHALALPPHLTLADYLAGDEWQTAVPQLWQSLFAIALDGSVADAGPADQIAAVVRLGLLMVLASEGIPTMPMLATAEARNFALCARPVFPDFVATRPPVPALRGGNDSGRWEALGIGQLQVARHRLLGYTPGELADVVNVMPRERQEVSERSLLDMGGSERSHHARERESSQRRQRSESSDLANVIAEVMAADGVLRNLSNVTPAYDNLNMSLSGSWSGAGANAGWQRGGSAALAQRITELASRRMHERVSHRRGLEWQALRERRSSQQIDNSGHDRLVGLYHWVDRVVRVRLEPLGARLVLAFHLPQPAQPWLQHLCRLGPIPLQPPPPLPSPQPGQPPYSVVTAANYQSLGAAYGLLDLQPPPASQLTLVASVQHATLGDLSLLEVPAGYSVSAGTATLAVADSRYALACSVGGSDLPNTATIPAAALSVTVPSCSSSTQVGAVTVAPDTDPVPKSSTSPLTGIAGATGIIPITVMTAAPSFAVTVQLQCSLDGTPSDNPLVLSWQMRVYARLQEAWYAANGDYQSALRERVHAAAQRDSDLQRQVLQQACLDVLVSSLDGSGHEAADMAPLFDWPHMTWHYSQRHAGSAQAWPEPAPSQRMRSDEDGHLHAFVHAQSARVLVPVLPGREPWLLSLLQFPVPWAGGFTDAPATQSTVALLEELLVPGETEPPPAPWTLRVPTTLLYLQSGSQLTLPQEGTHGP